MKFKDRWLATVSVIKSLFNKEVTFDGVTIQGEPAFSSTVKDALALLKERSPDALRTVKDNVDIVFQCTTDMPSTFGKDKGSLAVDVKGQTLTWVAGKLYYEAKKISVYRLLRNEGLRPKQADWGYKKIADEHYRIMTEIGTEFEELKDLADWIEKGVVDRLTVLAEYQPTGEDHVAKIPKGVKTKEELLTILSKELNFPDYFGMNWDALDECLQDLGWIGQKDVAIVHEDVPLANPEDQGVYFDILFRAKERWSLSEGHKLHIVIPKL